MTAGSLLIEVSFARFDRPLSPDQRTCGDIGLLIMVDTNDPSLFPNQCLCRNKGKEEKRPDREGQKIVPWFVPVPEARQHGKGYRSPAFARMLLHRS